MVSRIVVVALVTLLSACEFQQDVCAREATRVDGKCVFLDAANGVDASDSMPGNDGSVSEGAEGGTDACAVSTWYADNDGDELGDSSDSMLACSQPSGYVSNADDRFPTCGRAKDPDGCAPGAMRCASGTVGDREICTEDTAFPGCTDWKPSAACSAGAAVCSGDGKCGKCSEDSQCAGFDAAKVCDTAAGVCVQCTGAKASACGGDVCDSLNRTCEVGVKPASADLCEPCVSDAHCGKTAPSLCMPTSFGGTSTGNFCLPKLSAGETCIDSQRPYVAAAVDANQVALVSIDGSTAPSCKLALTTCAALGDFRNKSCSSPSDDAACGVAGLDDGMCVPVPAQSAHRCSVPCLGNDDCKVGSACTGSGYCSL
jgi:hypothetical protein